MRLNQSNNKVHLIIKASAAFFFIIPLNCYIFARRMPYLLNMQNMWIYFSFCFATTSLLFIYFAFVHKPNQSEVTRYQAKFSAHEVNDPLHKVKITLCVLFLFAGIIWMSWGIVGLGAYLFSKEPHSEAYIFKSLKSGGRKGLDLTLIKIINKNEYMLTLSRPSYTNTNISSKIGYVLCGKGRSSFLGVIITDLSIGECKLDGFRLKTPNTNETWGQHD